jgi:hypothetical protein
MQPASLPSTLSITAVGRHAVVPPGVAKALVNRRNDGERVGLPRQIARHIAVGQPRDDLKLGTHEGAVPLGVVGNESVDVIVDVGVAARYPASSSLCLGPTSFVLGSSLSIS